MTDSVLLYAAGALDAAEAEEVRNHLASGCPRCAGLLAEAEATVALLPMALPVQKPGAEVKQRLMSRVGTGMAASPMRMVQPELVQQAPAQQAPWWAPIFIPSAIAALVTAGLAIFFATRLQPQQMQLPGQIPQPLAINNEQIIGQLTAQLEDAKKELDAIKSGQTSQVVSWAAAPNMKFLWLDGTDQQPGAGGRIFWDTKSGTWHFFAQGVKKAPAGETYELWYVPTDGKPVAAGEFDPSASGDASMVSKVPGDIAGKITVGAVTDEPVGKTITSPSGKFQFMGKVQ